MRIGAILLTAAILTAAAMARADAPAVTVVYPVANLTISEASTPVIRLQASVTDADEAIAIVAYYVCLATGPSCSNAPVIAGTSAAPPFDVLWTPSQALTNTAATLPYLVWAEAQNVLGQSRQSAAVPFTLLQPPPAPSVTLIAPSLPSDFILPAAPVLYATAVPGTTSPPSSIVGIDFLDAGAVIGSVAVPNATPTGYAFVWRDVAPGEHLVWARATDSLGYTADSAPLSIFVLEADDPPQVGLGAPANGDVYAPGAVIALSATASSTSGAIERVEFVEGQTVIATVRSEPYAAQWVNPPPGNFAIVARAFDDLGVSGTSQAAYIQVLEAPRSPLVVLTAPTSGSTVSATSPLALAASAFSPDGSVGQVDFYAGATLLGSSGTRPYTFSWLAPQIGSQTLYAKARDLSGRSATSASVSIIVASSLAPAVSLSAPASGATFTVPASITVSANASEAGGSVAKVDFYADGALIGTKTAAPYSITWTSAAAGGHMLSAKATDGAGVTATSAGVPITVFPPSPTISVTAANGSRFAAGQSIALTAQATTPGSTIVRVEFESDGTLIGTITAGGGSSGTYTLNWSGASAGTHAVLARVVAASGASTASASIGVTVTDLAVNLLAPAHGQVFQTSTPIALAADATETGGTIARVEFYADGVLVATTMAPYTAAWNGSSAGPHTLVAKAVDATGLAATSTTAAVTVLAAPTIQIDAGIEGATVNDDNVTISGSVQAPLNSAVAVNGREAVLDLDGHFFVENFKLQSGSNPLTVTLNTQDSAAVVKTLNVNSAGAAPFEVALDRQQGLAPLTVNLTISNRGNVAFKRITVDTTDDGTPDIVLTGLPSGGTTQAITYGAPGLYTIRIIVLDSNDRPIYTATRRVRAIDPAEIGYKLASVYTTLVNNLAANNVSGALSAFVDGARERYSDVFVTLGASLSTVAGQLGNLSDIVILEEAGELTIARPVGSDMQLFMIYLIRGKDGIWRIETM